jgi:hypothetical protein
LVAAPSGALRSPTDKTCAARRWTVAPFDNPNLRSTLIATQQRNEQTLDQIAAHIGVNLSVAPDDLAYGDFFNRGGSFAAARTFGAAWPQLLDELNTALVA